MKGASLSAKRGATQNKRKSLSQRKEPRPQWGDGADALHFPRQSTGKRSGTRVSPQHEEAALKRDSNASVARKCHQVKRDALIP